MIKLLVLSMLSIKPMSGYDIKSMLEVSDTQRWAGALPGSIYNALQKLEKDSYIEIDSVETNGNRQKANYKITNIGKEYQKELVTECLDNSKMNYPTDLYTGISFADQLPTQEAITHLEKNKEALMLEYNILEKGLIAKRDAMHDHLPELTQIIFENMFEDVNSQIKLVDKAIAILDKKSLKS